MFEAWGQDVGHIVALLNRLGDVVEVIGRHLVAAVVASAVVLVGGSGGLLASLGNVGVEVEFLMALEIALVALGVVAKLHGAAPVAVEPHRKPLVIQAQDFGGGRAQIRRRQQHRQ
jgi:hypothetical protein